MSGALWGNKGGDAYEIDRLLLLSALKNPRINKHLSL
jgi:hypothetical protein